MLRRETDGEKGKNLKKEAFEWISSILWAIVIAFIIKTFIFNTTFVRGSSMSPTLEERDRLVAEKVSLYFKPPQRGQIIVLEAPDDPNKDYIKRVIGVPGDTVTIVDGRVFVNEELIEEDYIQEGLPTQVYDENFWKVGEDELFILGDNRLEGASKDSRYFGTIKLDSVKGIANFRYYPLGEKFGRLN